ncbi:MAG: GAF domain-containing sensor histidine kinase [Candidatus Binatus sp.]
MPAAPVPSTEPERLLELRRYQVLDTDPEEAFDAVTRLASQLTGAPFALVSLTDESRQWFKSRVGVTLVEIPRDWAPCAHVVFERRSIVCEDMRLDPRFADNPLVTGPPHVSFYAGMALVTPRGAILGTLAVMDTVPRNLTEFQREALTLLAQQIVDQLELRMAYRDLTVLRTQEREFEKRLRAERMNEAQHLAAELHDDVAQDLVGIALLLGALRRTPAAQTESVSEPLQNASQLLSSAIERCRLLAQGFGGFMVHTEGVMMALRQFVESRTASAIRFEFSGDDSSPPDCLDDTVAYELFRIGREAITNACHHSQCTTVRVICEHNGSEIRLAVEDNGVGLSDAQNSSAGIGRCVMEYRARTIGGALRYTSVDGGGLRVECSVPCSTPDTRADTDQTRAPGRNRQIPAA